MMTRFELPAKTISLRQARKAAADFLMQQGISDAQPDADLLFERASGLTGAAFFLHRDEEMDARKRQEFEELVNRRGQRIPVQQILSEAWFFGRRFFVNDAVLIPRMDTEILVEEALTVLREGMSVLDLCTGSGCIILTLQKERKITAAGTDLSKDALAVAEKNARLLEADCAWVQSDLFEKVEGRFDMIVSNPPYIRSSVIEELDPEVRDYEPRMALDGGADGLGFYRRIAAEAPAHLVPGGHLLLEIGYDQKEAVSAILAENGFERIAVVPDLASLPRVVHGIYMG